MQVGQQAATVAAAQCPYPAETFHVTSKLCGGVSKQQKHVAVARPLRSSSSSSHRAAAATTQATALMTPDNLRV